MITELMDMRNQWRRPNWPSYPDLTCTPGTRQSFKPRCGHLPNP